MKDTIRRYVREALHEGVKVTGGGHTFKAKPGSQVSFTDATSGKPVSGTFKKKVSRGGYQYAHVETGKSAHYVPVHQMHGAKKIDEDQLDEKLTPDAKTLVQIALGPKVKGNELRQSSKSARAMIKLAKTNPKNVTEDQLDELYPETKKSYIKTAARDLKNIGLVQGAHSQANPRPNAPKGSHDDLTKTNLRMMKNREKGIERALKEDDMMINLKKRQEQGPKYKSGYGYDSDAHYAKQTPKMQTAINLHLRKGKSYNDAVAAAKKHVKD